MKRVFKILVSFPKTLIFNLKVFPFQTAIKLPVIVHYHMRFGKLSRGCIELPPDTRIGMIKLGFGMGSEGVFFGSYPKNSGGGFLSIASGCKIRFNGVADFAAGVSIRLENQGIIVFGDNFRANSYCFFSACKLIKFGDDCLCGWHVNIRDVDGHNIYNKDDIEFNNPLNLDREVIIGNHVWIASCVDILKGTHIASDCIVAYGTLLTGTEFDEEGTIIGGSPSKILKHHITWKY